MTDPEKSLRSRLRRLPDEPRVVATGNHVTPWHTLGLLDEALPAYKLWVLNAQPGVPDRDGVTLETAFVGPGMRKSPRLSYTPCRLSLVPELFSRLQPPDVVLLHTTRPRDGKVSLGHRGQRAPGRAGGRAPPGRPGRRPGQRPNALDLRRRPDPRGHGRRDGRGGRRPAHGPVGKIDDESARSARGWPSGSRTAPPCRPASARSRTRPCAGW